jgi:hypothetical protein
MIHDDYCWTLKRLLAVNSYRPGISNGSPFLLTSEASAVLSHIIHESMQQQRLEHAPLKALFNFRGSRNHNSIFLY